MRVGDDQASVRRKRLLREIERESRNRSDRNRRDNRIHLRSARKSAQRGFHLDDADRRRRSPARRDRRAGRPGSGNSPSTRIAQRAQKAPRAARHVPGVAPGGRRLRRRTPQRIRSASALESIARQIARRQVHASMLRRPGGRPPTRRAKDSAIAPTTGSRHMRKKIARADRRDSRLWRCLSARRASAPSASSTSSIGATISTPTCSRTSPARPASRSSTTLTTPTRCSRRGCSPARPAMTSSCPRRPFCSARSRPASSAARQEQAAELEEPLAGDRRAGSPRYDPGNAYAVNYMWYTTGDRLQCREDQGAPRRQADHQLGSGAAAGELEEIRRLRRLCARQSRGHFLDHAQLSETRSQLERARATSDAPPIISPSLRRYIKKFHSSEYINALANGDICLAIGWAGDSFQARNRAREAGNGVEIAYVIPHEGTLMSLDNLAIPKDAPHPEEALSVHRLSCCGRTSPRATPRRRNFANGVVAVAPADRQGDRRAIRRSIRTRRR